MRRLLLLTSLLATLVLALAACGDDDDGDGPAATTSTGGEAAFPVTVRSKFGSQTIERAPTRVVTLDNQATDDALALGVTPVGIAETTFVEGGVQEWTKAALGGKRPPLINADSELPFERIASMRPDLILAPHTYLLDKKAYERLRRIAPTVHFTDGPQEDDWQQTTLRIGQALGKPERAKELVAEAEQGLAAAKERTPELDGATVNIFNAVAAGVYTINNPEDYSLRLLGQLGLHLPDAVRTVEGAEYGRAKISAERYDLLDSDLLIGTSGESPEVLEKLSQDKLFSRLDVVREGRYVPHPIGQGTALAFPSVLSVPFATRTVIPILEKALGGGDDRAAFPTTLEHKFGRTTIEKRPERVVTAGYSEQDAVLALGVKPVGVREFLGGYDWRARPWAQAALGGERPKAIGGEEINFEAVAAQRPDLIIAMNSGISKGDFERLSKIAPTVAQSGDVVDFGMPWQEQTVQIGKALGREAEARGLVTDVEQRFADVRKQHPAFVGASAVLAYGGPDGYGAYSTQDTRSRFLADLGFEIPGEIDEIAGDAFFTALSKERFRLLDRDAVMMFGPQKEISRDPVFGRLDAVKRDRVIYLDLGDQISGALGFASVLSLPYLLDHAVPALAAAVDGDPTTKVDQPR
ncbi:MAG: iron-siderophore ABC transporter substrate-binding protein [Solirubrobacteraceae bacterium]